MALPLTIFIVALMTVTLAAAFVRVDAERQMAVGGADAVDAETVAQSGLQAYLGSRTARPPDGDSLRFNLAGGYADVVARIIQRPADTLANEMYVVRSTGYVITPRLGPVPQATRTVAQFAQWQSPTVDVVAAYTAANKVMGTADSVTITGADACNVEPAANGMVTINGSNVKGTSDITGVPSGYSEQGAGAAVASLADIDWAATISGGLVPDYTTFRPNDTSYPAMLVTGDLVLQDAVGYGLLIVTGDLSLEGASDTFHGVLLVGGGIDFVANSITLDGVVKSGLNEQLQGAAGKTSTDKLGTSRVRMQYDSCEITKALQSLQGFAPIRNARVDTWGTY